MGRPAIPLEIGSVFGKLTVRGLAAPTKFSKLWRVQCCCGKYKETTAHKLINGHTTTCGDPICKTTFKKGEAGLNNLYSSYKYSAKKRQLDWNLSLEDVRLVTTQNCYYCNIIPQQVIFAHKNRTKETIEYSKYIYNGIDRIDNSLGYLKNNIVPCCKSCNIAKRDLSQEEFMNLINQIYNNWARKCQN